LQSSALNAAAAKLQTTPMQVALAWLLQRSPNMLLIGVIAMRLAFSFPGPDILHPDADKLDGETKHAKA
jgi:hypothetical protein